MSAALTNAITEILANHKKPSRFFIAGLMDTDGRNAEMIQSAQDAAQLKALASKAPISTSLGVTLSDNDAPAIPSIPNKPTGRGK